MRSVQGSPLSVKALSSVQFLMAAIAVPSGILLLLDPSGAVMGGQFVLPHLKAVIPFLNDFTPIGLWLLTVYGVAPVVLAVNLLMGRRWAWMATVLLGLVEVGWIATEIVLFYDLGFTPMYPLIGGVGIATLSFALLPSLRRYYSRKT